MNDFQPQISSTDRLEVAQSNLADLRHTDIEEDFRRALLGSAQSMVGRYIYYTDFPTHNNFQAGESIKY